MKNNIQNDIINNLYNRKVDKGTLLSTLKNLEYKEARKVIRTITNNQLAKSLIQSKPTPQKISELRASKLSAFTGLIEGEIAWIVESIKSNNKEINQFIQKEREFEKYILLDDTQKANDCIRDIESNICYSYWGIENKFSLEQQTNGSEGNWKLLSVYNETVDNSYTLFFNGIFSKKAEKDVSLLQYERSIENEIRNLDPNIARYLVHKIGYFLSEDYSINDLSFFIFLESTSSVIDRYLQLISVLTELVSIPDTKEFAFAVEVIKELDSIISDTRISRLLEICGVKKISTANINEELYFLFDEYTKGNYQTCLERIPELLLIYPSHFELYELYVKCIADNNNGYCNTDKSITIDFILKNLFDLLTRNHNYDIAKENLLKFYIAYPNLTFTQQLFGVIGITCGFSSLRNMYSHFFIINSKFFNSYAFYIAKDKQHTSIDENLYEYLNVKINYGINHNRAEYLDVDCPSEKRELYTARMHFINQNHSECISICNPLLKKVGGNSIIEEECIYMLYYSCIKTKDLNSALTIAVDAYFKNKNYLSRLNTNTLVNEIIDSEYNIEKSIELPILFYINNCTNYYQYVALDEYLNDIKANRPSQIHERNKKTVFLLKHVCQVEILDKFYLEYQSYSEVVEERKNILKLLITLDEQNVDSYFEELATITQKEKIKSIINTINDGKIKLKFSQIKAKKEYSVENSFNRFLKLKEFTKSNNIHLIDSATLFKGYLDELNNDNKQLQEASFLTFKSIVLELVDFILFSKEYGLDGDISTRIRHGVLENQIRSVFVKNNIISKKSKDSTYENIDFWDNRGTELGVTQEVKIKIQDLLKDFSLKVDSVIQYIISNQMQIYSNKYTDKKNGLFDYYFSNDMMWILFREVSDKISTYNFFLDYVFEILQGRTESNLKDIRTYFKVNINDKLQENLNELQNNIKTLIGNNMLTSEISEKIIHSKTQISYELDSIAGWFKQSSSKIDEALDLETIIHTSVELINFSNPNNTIHPKVNCDNNTLFTFYSSFIDIFKILLGNVITHSKLPASKTNIVINVSSEENSLNEESHGINLDTNQVSNTVTISIKNSFSDTVNVNELEQKLSEIKANWKNRELDNANKEGGSGYLKIKRILNHETGSFGNNFDYAIDQNTLEIKLSLLSISNIINYE